MSMKSMTMIPPMSRNLSWRANSATPPRLFLLIASSRPPPPPLDRRPDLLQDGKVASDLLLRAPLGRRPVDQAALGQIEPLRDGLQPFSLGVLEASRHADPVPERHVDDEAAGEGDLRR